jgi:hypothetical protein
VLRRTLRSHSSTALSVAGALAIVAATACDRRSPAPNPTPEPARARPNAGSPRAGTSTARASNATATTRPRDPPEPTVVAEVARDGGLSGLALGELSDIGPAGPATATEDGVVLLTKADRLALARSAKGPVRKGKIGSVSEPAASFAALGRPPAVAGGHAHWVSGGRLVRRRADGTGELEVLADGARDGTRVSATVVKDGVVVAYVGRADNEGTTHAKLWLGPGRTLDLTPEGAGASSVALATQDDRLIVVSIDGRSAMTPVHARSVLLDRPGPAALGSDVVAWVAGPAHSFTEVSAASDGASSWALLPIERDATHFGLATVSLGREPEMDAPVAFFDYANGIDLAPVATAKICGKPYLAFARPAAAAPRSPQELVISPINGGETAVIANAAGFGAVSLGAAPGGGLVAYTADGRTWARGLECR